MTVELPQHGDVDAGGGATVSVEAAMPAHWQPECVYDYLFRAPPDAVLLVLTAMATVQHVNAMAMGWARPHLARMAFDPVVIVNDPHGRNAGFPTMTGAQVRERHNVPWRIRETMIGNFYGDHLRWKEGAEETWRSLVNGM